jgi:hypothetical protein
LTIQPKKRNFDKRKKVQVHFYKNKEIDQSWLKTEEGNQGLILGGIGERPPKHDYFV